MKSFINRALNLLNPVKIAAPFRHQKNQSFNKQKLNAEDNLDLDEKTATNFKKFQQYPKNAFLSQINQSFNKLLPPAVASTIAAITKNRNQIFIGLLSCLLVSGLIIAVIMAPAMTCLIVGIIFTMASAADLIIDIASSHHKSHKLKLALKE